MEILSETTLWGIYIGSLIILGIMAVLVLSFLGYMVYDTSRGGISFGNVAIFSLTTFMITVIVIVFSQVVDEGPSVEYTTLVTKAV